MCGIYGMFSPRGARLAAPRRVDAMGAALRHRGPDSRGVVRRPRAALGCERLRVVDLSPEADPPFGDGGASCWMVCNGEIYNAADLRRRYRDYPYRSRSDVEVILPLYLDRGVAGLAELDGMFGLAIWDEPAGALILARDRAGEKPLFYTRVGGELTFASEIQALLVDARVSREIDETAIRQYLTLGYVPEPRTAFRDVRKIEAGTIVRFTGDGETKTRYWRPDLLAEAEPADGGHERLRSLLRSAVRKQMVADVPVGVFVSGGVDSSLLASLAAREAGGGFHTFVARFSEDSYDESEWAARCARLLGSRHHEVLVDERSLGEALTAVSDRLAEPLADPAILPTYLVAREARKHVTVVLSGEGADELFGGYPTYLGHKLAPVLAGLPSAVRRGMLAAAERLPASRRKVTLEFLVKRFLATADRTGLERHLAWFGAGAWSLMASGGPAEAGARWPVVAGGDVARAMLFDYRTYLRDGLLVKNDRATMLHSLEARAPFLDRDLTAYALSLPEHEKVRGLTTKWRLKKVAEEWLPRAMIHRRKRGLSVPVASWIDGGLRSEVDRLLDPERLDRQDLLASRRVSALLEEHRAGKANHARPLWTVLVLQRWLDRWAPDRAGGPAPVEEGVLATA